MGGTEYLCVFRCVLVIHVLVLVVCIHVHVEIRGQPWVSFLGNHLHCILKHSFSLGPGTHQFS